MTANTETKSTTAKTDTKTVAVEKPLNRIKDTDHNYTWTVIGLTDCEWTTKAINLLKAHKETVKFIPLTPEWQRRVIVEQNTRRLPAIFKNHAFFGGYDALENYYKCSFFSDSESFI